MFFASPSDKSGVWYSDKVTSWFPIERLSSPSWSNFPIDITLIWSSFSIDCCLSVSVTWAASGLIICDVLSSWIVDKEKGLIFPSLISGVWRSWAIACSCSCVSSNPRSAAELVTLPIQLVATQVYVPRQHEPSFPDMSLCMSPAFNSTPSLYQERVGCGTPITLHSRFTAPSSVSTAFNGSKNLGIL